MQNISSTKITNLSALNSFAKDIANNLKKGDVILLNGTLGAGKTTLARHIINHLSNASIQVTSPTFNIVNIYDVNKNLQVWHYDLYRIKSPHELEELAFDEAFNHITLIEWPEIAKDILPTNTININIEILDDNTRLITLKKSSLKL